MRDISTNITPQNNRKSNIRSPRKFKIHDTFWTDHVFDILNLKYSLIYLLTGKHTGNQKLYLKYYLLCLILRWRAPTRTRTHGHTSTNTHKHTETRANMQKHAQTRINTRKHAQIHSNAHTYTHIGPFLNHFYGCFTLLWAYWHKNLDYVFAL